ncbi:MAG: SBBP repeat-containing protein, partial [Roseiflexaceae bacterium]
AMVDLPRPINRRQLARVHGSFMNRLALPNLLMLLLSVALSPAVSRLQPRQAGPTDQTAWARAAVAHAPLMFVENIGQFARAARYALLGSSTNLTLADDGIWLTIHDRQNAPKYANAPEDEQPARAVQIKLSFVGANDSPRIEALQRLNTRVSYFTGADPAGWRSDVPAWSGVRYRELYPGVDLELSGANGQLASRLIARHPADLKPVHMRVQGADDLALADDALHLTTALGTFALPLPRAVSLDGTALTFAGLAPSLHGADVANPFAGGNSAGTGTTPPMSNDAPQAVNGLEYSRLFGGNSLDEGGGIAVDASNAAYVVGFTTSENLTGNPGRIGTTPSKGYNTTVIKVNPSGDGLEYLAIIGGKEIEYATGIAVDANGAAYICGYTSSNDFPTTGGAFDTNGTGISSSARQAFIFKLNANAQLVYSTYIGGNGDERATNVAIDANGNAYMTGLTPSANFPITAGAFQETKSGGDDAYVVKLNATGSNLVFSTYLGGTGDERGSDIKSDATGAVYVTGRSASANFPIFASYGSVANTGQNVFVTKLNPTGSSLLYSTLMGGSGNDNGLGIALDTAGAAYVTGYTQSTDFPTLNAFDPDANGSQDVFVVKLGPTGNLAYATYLGGSNFEKSTGIAVNTADEAYIVGYTESGNFPHSADSYDPSLSGSQDAFLVKLKLTNPGAGIVYGTFFGGSHIDTDTSDGISSDSGNAITLDKNGGVYITGEARPPDFPTTKGPAYGGGENDSFIAKFQLGAPVAPTFTISGSVKTQASAAVAGVTVTAGNRSTITDSNGKFTFADLPSGSVTITPIKANSTFVPASSTFNLSANLSDIEFTLQTAIFHISGRVTNAGGGAGLAGVTVADGTGGTATTDANGRYDMNLTPGTYTLTPARDNYIFTPSTRNLSVTTANMSDQDFSGVLIQPPKPVYISLMARIDAPKYCDEYESNNDRYNDPTRITIGQVIKAKFCVNEGAKKNPFEDNYVFTTSSSAPLKFTLSIPQGLLQAKIAFGIYNADTIEALKDPLDNCYQDEVNSTTTILPNCSITKAGTYIVRLYPTVDSYDKALTYTLQVRQ